MDSPRSDCSSSNGEELAAEEIMERIRSVDGESRIGAAREIRRLTKTSSINRRLLAGAVEPLVSMLKSGSDECAETAMLALLNLGVKDERNKIRIVKAGALNPIIRFLHSPNPNLQENATAALLTLTAATANRPAIASSGAIPLLVSILAHTPNPQTKIDSIMALHNLSALPETLKSIVSSNPVPPLISFLKTCKKSSKTAEKCIALLEPLLSSDDGRAALAAESGGVLAVVEVLEEGSPASKEFAVGALLTLCESDREKYREVILKEGAIPGLLELTVKGTTKSRSKAKALLHLLRKTADRRRPELEPAAIENIVTEIVLKVDGGDCSGKAKKMLAEMVQVSMEQSLRHMEQRALMCTPSPSK